MKKTHQPCPDCGSSDALTINEDGSTKCYSCGKFTGTYVPSIKKDPEDITSLYSGELVDRGISKDIAELYGCKCEYTEDTGELIKHHYPYRKDGSIVGYKTRVVKDKAFFASGTVKGVELYGQDTCSGTKMVIITEGECDAMAAKQLLREMGKDYNVVSLVNGSSDTSSIKTNLAFLEGFEDILLCFDQDKPGKKAVDTAVGLFTPGKVKNVVLPEKDANEMLRKGLKREFLKAIYNAKVVRPDGIVALQDSWEAMWEANSTTSIPYPWVGLNNLLYGLRGREIVTITGGSGIGKSALTREITHHLLKSTVDNIGVLALEESVARTAWGVVAIEANLPLSIREERDGVSEKDIRKWFDATLGTGRLYTLDHFGSTEEDNLISKVRYMIKALDCKWVVLDHLSIVVSAMDQGLDERKTIDSIMTKLRQLTEETGAGLILVTHLKRVDGNKGHENGIEVNLSHLRGSQSIAQLSDAVVAAERDQQADDPKVANTLTLRVLKNRYAGLVGKACPLYYNKYTGRLEEEEFEVIEEEDF